MTVDIQSMIVGHLDLATMRGVEFGALHSPRLRRDEADIYYVDHASRQELREKYASNPEAAPHAGNLVDVDFVWRPGVTMTELLAEITPVDYVIASHVLEHLPNPVGWLDQVADILRPDGFLSLVIPDRRFTFDVNRAESTLADLIGPYLDHVDTPSFRQVFDHEANFLGHADAAELWRGADLSGEVRDDVDDADLFALETCLKHRDLGGYRDVHCTVWTPASFLSRVSALSRLGLMRFSIASLHPTWRGSYEFVAVLQRLADDLDRREAGQLQREQVEACWPALAEAELPGPDLPTTSSARDSGAVAGTRELSRAELRVIDAKRAAMSLIRRRRRPS